MISTMSGDIWGSNFGPAKCYTALQTVHHRLNIYTAILALALYCCRDGPWRNNYKFWIWFR